MLSFLFLLIALIASVLFAVVALPYFVAVATSSENNHIYTIFAERSGYMTMNLAGLTLAFIPFLVLFDLTANLEDLIYLFIISCIGVYFHFQLFRGVKLISNQIISYHVLLILFVVLLGFMQFKSYITSSLINYLYILSTAGLGFYVNLIASRQIQHNKSLKRD